LDREIKRHEAPFLLHCATGVRAALLLRKAKQLGWTPEQTFVKAKQLGFDSKSSAEFSGFVVQALD